MPENNDLLVFKWNVKDVQLEEIFDPKEQNLLKENQDANDDKFEYSDYIFQMHSVVNTCVFDKLHEKREFAEEREKISSEILEFDTHVLKAVQCLKLISSVIYELKIKLQEFRSEGTISNPSEIAERVQQTFVYFYNFMPEVGYKDFIRLYFGKANKKFKDSGKWSEIDHGLSVIRNGIQRKADNIVQLTTKALHPDLWNTYSVCEKKHYDKSSLAKLKTAISELSAESKKSINILSVIANAYTETKESGCVAICFTNKGKYYSLSGVDDYIGKYLKIKKRMNFSNFNAVIACLSPGPDFKYAYLTDQVLCYGLYSKRDSCTPYFPSQLSIHIAHKQKTFCRRDVSCCERKIMARCKSASTYEFYIQRDPCDLCRPALLPKPRKKITFMTIEGNRPFVKLKVDKSKSYGFLHWYDFIDA